MASRILEVTDAGLQWLIAPQHNRVIGYAYASQWKGRCAYRFSVETTIYLDAHMTGKGIGTELYRALLSSLRAKSLHVAIGGVALPNDVSVALHERLGFEKVAHFKSVGFKFERWLDVACWQIEL